MKKLIVSKDFVENFTITNIIDYEGCPSAIKMLHKRYGSEVDHLSKRRQDFVDLIDKDNKPEWAMNFLLNLLKPEYRIAFYEIHFKESLLLVVDKKNSSKFKKILTFVKKNKTDEILDHLTYLKSLAVKNHYALEELDQTVEATEEVKNLYYEKLIAHSLIILLEDDAYSFTRSVNEALSKLAEVQSVKDLANSQNKLKNIAHGLIDYLEFFKD